MSGFKALNIESDDESDVEIDDTKEIQIEEALKLYQSALKYHAEGPSCFDQAEEAYRLLFQSEIFQYPESQAELERIELYGATSESDWTRNSVVAASLPVNASLDTGPSTLPQILHLSHKNYAQFKLDAISAKFDTLNLTLKHIVAEATAALDHFVQALDKDETDLDLWRRTASVGEMLDSKRIARFCLESVLDEDDEGMSGVWSLPGLDEGFAGDQLRDLVYQLQDQLSSLQTPLSMSKRRVLSKMLKQRLRPYSDIVERESVLRATQETSAPTSHSTRKVLRVPTTWAELGETLLQQVLADQHSSSSGVPGLFVAFDTRKLIEQASSSLDEISPTATSNPAPDPFETKPLPANIPEQYPGLDGGLPTVQPRIACAEPSMETTITSQADQDIAMSEQPPVELPSRKRSGDAAGINDGSEETRTKSRRIRARDSTIDMQDSKQALIDANVRWENEQQLNEIQAADDWMFDSVGLLFEKYGIVGTGSFDKARHVRQEMQSSEDASPVDELMSAGDDLQQTRSDIRAFLDKYTDQQAQVVLQAGENLEIGHSSSTSGMGGVSANGTPRKGPAQPVIMPDDGIPDFIQMVNESELLAQEVAWKFIQVLLKPIDDLSHATSYTHYLWPEQLKTMVVRILVNADHYILQRAEDSFANMKDPEALENSQIHSVEDLPEIVEAIYELHLDIYSLIKAPNSGVDSETIAAQGHRLARWSQLCHETISLRNSLCEHSELQDSLNLRFLWATTSNISTASDVTQRHVIECMNDLRTTWAAAEDPRISLQNNAIMPELSLAALDNEITKLTTRDFFRKITNQGASDPVSDIENLEPILEALETTEVAPDHEKTSANDDDKTSSFPTDLLRFLEKTDVSVRLQLWQKLREAYRAIDYSPMVVFCYFRMLRIVLEEMKNLRTAHLSQTERQMAVLKSLRLINDLIKNLFKIAKDAKDALQCIDGDGLKLATNSLAEVVQIIQVFNVAGDSIRVGQTQPPLSPNGLPAASFASLTTLMEEMQIYVWMILYALLKEAISQTDEQSQTPDEDRFDFLRTVHRNLGLRGICGASNRTFIRMLKDEFFGMSNIEGYDSEQSQVLYDLYKLNCFLNPSYELIEHHCTHDAFLDKSVALQAVDLLLQQASELPIKELIKHTLKDTIEKVHGSVLRKKPTEAVLRNRDLYRAFMRSSIQPIDLFKCLKGEGNQLPVITVPKEDAALAFKGWYFLMGNIALTKFRAQKRTAPAPTEDLDIAIAFFNQDLEATMEHWETWFRLAQAYDAKVEESVVWSAEKLNNNMADIIQLQRSAIHSYIMATALAHRSADPTVETTTKLTELYADFAMRLYSSSREPFGMLPFVVEDNERFISRDQAIYKGRAFEPVSVYTIWKLANVLLTRAIAGNPDSWMLHYMAGKCLWKMHSAPDNVRRRHDTPPSGARVVEAFVRAVDLLPPEKKDSRDAKREPVLEPHYKLTSIVHKLVIRGSISLEEAKDALDHTPHARREDFPQDMSEWTSYILKVLKNLRTADKSNWYHRMIARAAQIIYDEKRSDGSGSIASPNALGAKEELTKQMFTKTMVLQVWRPETERAGRHFVYTARYTRFFVQISRQLNDRASLEQLARRVRRRPHDVFEHSSVWQEICTAYLQLLRDYAKLPEGLETSTFSNIAHEDFLARKELLTQWMQGQETGESAPLDVLREVSELKKINQSLMKPAYIDDLIGDSYAYLFNTVGKQLWDDACRVKREEEARQPPPVQSPPRNPVMNLNHLMNSENGNGIPSATPSTATSNTAAAQNDQAPARRKIGVGRREIRAAAEPCFQKANVHSGTGAKGSGSGSGRVQSLIDSHRSDVPGDASVDTSAPGSIHDSADESELSELEEQENDEEAERDEEPSVARRPMFPGLASLPPNESKEESEGSDDGEEEVAQETENVDMVDGPSGFVTANAAFTAVTVNDDVDGDGSLPQ